jgi:hypothetical protein
MQLLRFTCSSEICSAYGNKRMCLRTISTWYVMMCVNVGPGIERLHEHIVTAWEHKESHQSQQTNHRQSSQSPARADVGHITASSSSW